MDARMAQYPQVNINKMKAKNHMISMAAKKKADKILCGLMTKTLNKLVRECISA